MNKLKTSEIKEQKPLQRETQTNRWRVGEENGWDETQAKIQANKQKCTMTLL